MLSQGPDQPPQYTRWMPRNGQRYFLVLGNGTVQRLQWHGTDFDQEAWSFGNCFRSRRKAERAREGIKEYLANFHREVALHLTVEKLTCNENGDPDILLLARFHAQPGGAYHGSHDGILPQ